MNFIKWFETYLEESKHKFKGWTITAGDDQHYIDTVSVIESIKAASVLEQAEIKRTIVAIDFKAGDVNHYFLHLAKCLVSQLSGVAPDRMHVLKKCGECDGTGKEKCWECDGDGSVSTKLSHCSAPNCQCVSPCDSGMIDCDDCDGTGKSNCWECGGDGNVEDED